MTYKKFCKIFSENIKILCIKICSDEEKNLYPDENITLAFSPAGNHVTDRTIPASSDYK
jgi:hypothetical protein